MVHRGRSSAWLQAAAILLALVAAAFALAGCGGDDASDDESTAGRVALGEETEATLVLDFVPNAVHTGIYCARGRGHYDANNIDLEIIEPTSTADTLKLIDSGKADFGIADGVDVANQITRGRGAKGIMALVQRPLGGVITLEEAEIESPADLEGATVGITGVPSDEATVDTVVTDAGADPSRVETVTIGFNGVQALEGGKVDAFTGFIAADGTQIEADGFPTTSFALDEHGGPRYPGLVVFSTVDAIEQGPDLMAAFVDATARGYRELLADPEGCLEELLRENPALDEDLQRAQLDAYEPLFQADAPTFGAFQEEDIEELSTFLLDSGLAEQGIAFERYATNEFVSGRDDERG